MSSMEREMKPLEPTTKRSIWITPREAAEYLNAGLDIIYAGCAAGGLKHVRLDIAPSVCGANGSTAGRRR